MLLGSLPRWNPPQFVPNSEECSRFVEHSTTPCLKSHSKPSNIAPEIKKENTTKRTERFESDREHDKNYKGVVAIVDLLKVCARKKDLNRGRAIHIDVIGTGLVEKNAYVGSALVSFYMKCGKLAKAEEIFNNIEIRDGVCWTALIAGYAQHGYGELALKCVDTMKLEGFSPECCNICLYLESMC